MDYYLVYGKKVERHGNLTDLSRSVDERIYVRYEDITNARGQVIHRQFFNRFDEIVAEIHVV